MHDTSYIRINRRVYYSGIMASGMSRQTGKKKYLSKAKKFAEELKQLVRARGFNSLHRQLLMEAELVNFKNGNEEKGRAKYDQAIAAALKAGHVHDAALACELAGGFLLRIGNSKTCWIPTIGGNIHGKKSIGVDVKNRTINASGRWTIWMSGAFGVCQATRSSSILQRCHHPLQRLFRC